MNGCATCAAAKALYYNIPSPLPKPKPNLSVCLCVCMENARRACPKGVRRVPRRGPQWPTRRQVKEPLLPQAARGCWRGRGEVGEPPLKKISPQIFFSQKILRKGHCNCRPREGAGRRGGRDPHRKCFPSIFSPANFPEGAAGRKGVLRGAMRSPKFQNLGGQDALIFAFP